MKKKIAWTIAASFCLIIATTLVYAANVHFKTQPTFTDNGTTLTACASLAGLGNQDITITVTTTGTGSTTCVNPGGNTAPGQNKVAVAASVTQTINASQIKNGTVSFCETTPGPGGVSAKAAGCPNGNWSASISDVSFETATITVTQGGATVLEQTFALSQ